ncbi:VP5 [Great Island virus]|uniref:Outer capsid protein VP5 n=1 Tax=Great Island virus TaxID=204269 RepID=E1AA94_9REOV|nr:VP5 [Great Island virus]ADM88597.1 VP5 [Great Island virus]
MTSKRLGTRLTGFLSRIGSGISKAVRSDTTKRVLSAAGRAAERAISSEVGQRAITGAVEGMITSATTGESLGESVKRAVILNVAGVHQTVPDPLNPAEIETQTKLRELELANRREEAQIKHNKIMIERERDALKDVTQFAKIQEHIDDDASAETKDLENALRAAKTLVKEERHQLDKVTKALIREDRLRSADERRLIEGMRHNYKALAKSVEAERNALIEEAVEQTIDIGGEIAEHATAAIPLVGEAVASGMATARGAMQIYRLGKTIHAITGLHTSHCEIPAIHQGAIETLLVSDAPTSDSSLAQITSTRARHLKEIESELDHLNAEVAPVVRKMCQDISAIAPDHMRGKHRIAQMNAAHELRVPLKHRPMIHTYTSPWDSDYVLILHVVGPYHTGQAFVFCLDLALDLFHFEEVQSPSHPFHHRHTAIRRTFIQVCTDFFMSSARHPGATRVHSTRMAWSADDSPLHIGSIPYETSYGQMLDNARSFSSTPQLQQALLRGPISMQRRTVLNAIMHGSVLVQARRRNLPAPVRRRC